MAAASGCGAVRCAHCGAFAQTQEDIVATDTGIELLEPTHPMTANRLKASIGDLWLQSAKHARKAGIYQQVRQILFPYRTFVVHTVGKIYA
ncbi:hypothetical protein RR46_00016 [Papilio xuthus]|uniref:Uncharacterized protein n=1 Tax=Papilio xuthus TaxID=66420 RepID=A0A0N1IBP1_PAPXU|nr:hypothetical protein RR46_00016 [Papilio xuthus]